MSISYINKITNIKAPILITGPSGTGKSKMAKKIFEKSRIFKEKFLTLHLASLKEDLLESELFGHKKGAFTGANENKVGYFQDVGKGTLFLDEVGELSLEAQKKLLYLLEEKKFTPIGCTHAMNFQGRLIMATNKDLKAMVSEGQFREDLFYRLNVFQIKLEPICKDKEKLAIEIENLFEKLKSEYFKEELVMTLQLRHLLINSEWRGNYRELKNCLEYLVAMSDGLQLEIKDLPEGFLNVVPLEKSTTENFISNFPEDFNMAIENFEKWYLSMMFERFSGRVNQTARVLGISKTTLISKAKKYQINTLQIRAVASVEMARNKAA